MSLRDTKLTLSSIQNSHRFISIRLSILQFCWFFHIFSLFAEAISIVVRTKSIVGSIMSLLEILVVVTFRIFVYIFEPSSFKSKIEANWNTGTATLPIFRPSSEFSALARSLFSPSPWYWYCNDRCHRVFYEKV